MEQNLSQYKIFYEVARAGNISKAAKELFISQPAISKSISKLEDGLGASLFSRNSRGVQLTAEGKLLFEYTKTAFTALNEGERELKRIQELHIGHLRIGGSNTLCRFVMVNYLKEFIGQYPHIKISIESQSSTHTLALIEQERIDIGLIAAHRTMKNLVFLPIMDIEDIFVTTPAYLKNLKLREGDAADIFESGNLLLLDRSNQTRHYIDDYLHEHHIVARNVLEVTGMDLLIEFARIGLVAACVIREFVKEDLEQGSLVQLKLSTPINKRTIGFAYCPNRSSNVLQSFVQFCHSFEKESPLL